MIALTADAAPTGPGADEPLLATFRTDHPPHDPAAWPAPATVSTSTPTPPPGRAPALRAERIHDHRAVYLDREGPLSAGRGEVRRLERGSALIRAADERRIELELRFAERPPITLVGERDGPGPWWTFVAR